MVAQLDKAYITTRPARALARMVSYALYEGRPLTTSGRWINPLLEWRFRRLAARPHAQVIDRPVYILGTGRSGTTVLGKVLSMHRDVGWLNEPKLMWHVAHPNEDLNGNYTLAPARYRLDDQDAAASTVQTMRNLYASYLNASRNTRVVDKYPELIFRIPFVKHIFPDARFIFLVRSGNDTCQSISAWSDKYGVATNGPDDADWWGTDRRKWHTLVDEVVAHDPVWGRCTDDIRNLTRQSDMAAVEWVLSMREGLRAMDEHGDSMYMLRYEALAADPRAELSRLFSFCGFSDDDTTLTYASNTLRPPRQNPPLQVHELIRDEYAATMSALGY